MNAVTVASYWREPRITVTRSGARPHPMAPITEEEIMPTAPDLMERLCRSLAFHLVESELTLAHADGDIEDWRQQCATARELIAEAGFDIDELYPVEDRPTAGPES